MHVAEQISVERHVESFEWIGIMVDLFLAFREFSTSTPTVAGPVCNSTNNE